MTCDRVDSARARPSRCRRRWSTRTATWTHRRGSPGSTRPTRSAWAAEVGVTRVVQIGCDLDGLAVGGRGGRALARGGRRGGHPSQRRGPDAVRSSSTALDRDRGAGPAPAGPGGGGDRPGLLPHTGRRTARRCSGRRSPRTSPWPRRTTRRWSSTTGTPTPRCSTCWTPKGSRTASSCTASPATPRSPEECLSRGAYLSFAGTVTFKANRPAAGGARRDPARPDPGRDRRALS